jgi:hypothetical protein
MPLVLAPTGFTRMLHYQGGFAVAAAAADAAVPYTLSTMGTVACPIRAQTPAQLQSVAATHGQPFSLHVRKLPSQSMTGCVFQVGHASSILVTRSRASPLVNALSLRSSYSNTEMARITRLVICFMITDARPPYAPCQRLLLGR